MQGFQIPKPSGIPPAGKRVGVPGRPGPQPGARPGLPKPKNPVIAGGKPMVPITNLMQFVPRPVSEEDSENKEGLENGISMPENIESENKGEERNEKNAQREIEDQDNLSKGEEIVSPVKSGTVKEHEKSPLNGKLEDQHSNLLEINGHHDGDNKDHDPETRINEVNSASKKAEQIQDPEDILFVNKETDHGVIQPINHQTVNENKVTAKEEEEERPPVMSPFSPEKDALKVITKTENNAASPESSGLGVKSPFGNPFLKKVNSPNPNLSIQKEDMEESDKLNQSPSPLIRNKNHLEEQEGRSTQDEQIDSRLHSDPSSGLSHEAKYKDRLDEVIEECSPMVTQDSNLLFKVKMLELELEKERKERITIKAQHENLLQENIELRHQLSETNLKLHGLTKQGGAEKDLLRKDEEIRRLKSELKSTMEGSRLVTEHSNRVISESAKFKEESRLLLASLEKEKEELHASFIEYKKQIQQEYISKLASMQEKVSYLEEKVQQYEGDIERHHSDLKSKSYTVHKLAQINNDVQSTLDNWPSFKPIVVEVQVPSILDHELVNTKSPILEALPNGQEVDVEVDQVGLNEATNFENEPQVQDEEVQEQEEAIDIAIEARNEEEEEGIVMDINIDAGVANVADVDVEEGEQPQEAPEYVPEPEENQQEQEEIQELVEENQWNVEEPILFEVDAEIEVGVDVEDKPQEENQIFVAQQEEEEVAETRKNIDEDVPAFEPTNQPELEEINHHHINEEPIADIQPEEPKVSVDAFTAPPAYRMPQKKKNAAPQPKPQPVQFIQPVIQHVQPEPEIVEQPPVEVDEPKPIVDAFTAPPAYRMPQKKKGGPAQPKRQPPVFGGFTPAPAQNFEEPVAAQDPEEGGATNVSQPEPQNEEDFEKPPMMMGSPNKNMSPPPKMNTPFGRPPMGMKSSPVERFVPIDKVQPLQNDIPNGVISNHPENDEHIELDRTSHTSLDHQSDVNDKVMERRISQDMTSQDEIDIQRPSQGSINNSGGRGKIVPSKAIKKRNPGQGSIYS